MGGTVDLVGLEGIRVVGIARGGLLRNAELVLHAADAEAAGIGPGGSIVVRHRHPPGERRDGLAGLSASIDPAAYAGCFVPRRISEDRARLSRHSWGIAFDINVDLSLPGLGPPPPPEVAISAATASGGVGSSSSRTTTTSSGSVPRGPGLRRTWRRPRRRDTAW